MEFLTVMSAVSLVVCFIYGGTGFSTQVGKESAQLRYTGHLRCQRLTVGILCVLYRCEAVIFPSCIVTSIWWCSVTIQLLPLPVAVDSSVVGIGLVLWLFPCDDSASEKCTSHMYSTSYVQYCLLHT